MTFFLIWIMTRVRERGWPKSEGLLRRRKVIDEATIAAATQDAVRIAVTIGGSLPDVAKAIAITFSDAGHAATGEDVDKWISEAAARGEAKMKGLVDVYPQWLRLCSITATDGVNAQHHLWDPSTGDLKYDMESPETNEMLVQSTALAGIAMCWALRNPNEAQDSFHDPDAMMSLEDSLGSIEPGIQELVGSTAIYGGWLQMAEMLVSRYSEEEGFPRYEDLA